MECATWRMDNYFFRDVGRNVSPERLRTRIFALASTTGKLFILKDARSNLDVCGACMTLIRYSRSLGPGCASTCTPTPTHVWVRAYACGACITLLGWPRSLGSDWKNIFTTVHTNAICFNHLFTEVGALKLGWAEHVPHWGIINPCAVFWDDCLIRWKVDSMFVHREQPQNEVAEHLKIETFTNV